MSETPVERETPLAHAPQPARPAAYDAPEATPTPSAPGAGRHPVRRLGFRVLALYVLLYTLPFPLDNVPKLGDRLSSWVTLGWKKVGTVVADVVFGLSEIYTGPTGSGDTTLDYVKLFLMAVLAIAGALVWTLVDRRRHTGPRAGRWLEVLVRYYLAIVLLSYGLVKVIPTQFVEPSLDRLLRTFGDASPMGMVWTFMGMSPAYTIFSGLAETLAGVLVVIRRTRLLGALVAIGVMTNVALLNYCYDVPVKLFSTHLLLMAAGLALLDGRRLLAFFVTGEAVPARSEAPLFTQRRWRIAGGVLGAVLVSWAAYNALDRAWDMHNSFGNARPQSALRGIYDVETFVRDGETLPPLQTDERRWRTLVVDRVMPVDFGGGFRRPGSIAILPMDGSSLTYVQVALDEDAGTFTRIPDGHMSLEGATGAGAEITDVLHVERPTDDRLVLRGRWQEADIEVTLIPRDLGAIELIGRGFHWINARPRNR